MVGEQKDPISFLCSLEKSSSKEQIKSKDKRMAATTTMYKKKKKQQKMVWREAEYLILASNSSNSAQSKIKSKLSDLNTICLQSQNGSKV